MASSVQVKVVMNRPAINRLLRDQNQPVMRRTMIFAEKVKRQAIQEIHSDFPRRFLGERMVKRYGVDSRGAYVDVGSHQTRTRPHPIFGNPLLVFYWKRAGRVVRFTKVNHPGSDFGPYLRKILTAAVNKTRGQF